MTFTELISKYDFHDSLITNIEKNDKVEITIDFCHWKQDYFKDGMKETGEIKLVFQNAKAETCLNGDIDYFSILDIDAKEDYAIIHTLDDFNETEYSIKITYSSVEVIM